MKNQLSMSISVYPNRLCNLESTDLIGYLHIFSSTKLISLYLVLEKKHFKSSINGIVISNVFLNGIMILNLQSMEERFFDSVVS